MSRRPASYPTAILQRITATNQFDGTLSAGAESTTRNGSMYEFAAAAAGGLFYWDNSEPMVIDQVLVDLGAAGNCEIYIVNLDAAYAPITTERWQIANELNVRYVEINKGSTQITLLPFQALQIVSTASAAAKTALVTGAIERTKMR